ncbi:MAG TPA: zf-HC2 domain-containing protein [Acidobacteriota bacterium]|nr:zf-HC2 domain-containing protein [Acidobacteriota bacterium]
MPHVEDSQVHAYLDGECSAAERDAIERHSGRCEPCRSLMEEAAVARSLASQLVGELPPDMEAPAWEEMLHRAGTNASSVSRSQGRWRRDLAWAATLVLAFGLGWQANRGFAPEVTSLSGDEGSAAPSQEGIADLADSGVAPPASPLAPAADDRLERSLQAIAPASPLPAVTADEVPEESAAGPATRRLDPAAAPEPLSMVAPSARVAADRRRQPSRAPEEIVSEVISGGAVAELEEQQGAAGDPEEDRLVAGRLQVSSQARALSSRYPSETGSAAAIDDLRISDELVVIDAAAAADWLGAPPLQLVGVGAVDVSVGPGTGLPDAARGRLMLQYRYVLESGIQVKLAQQFIGSTDEAPVGAGTSDAAVERREVVVPPRREGNVRSTVEGVVFSVHPNGERMLRWRDRRGYLVWMHGAADEATLRRLAAALRS